MSKKKLGEMARAAQPKKKGHDDLTKLVLGSQGGDIGAAIKQAQVDADKKSAEAVAQTVIAITQSAQANVESMVAKVRSLRAQERNELKKIREINNAAQYAAQTGNYIPLAMLTGSSAYDFGLDIDEDKALLTVPKDWAPAK